MDEAVNLRDGSNVCFRNRPAWAAAYLNGNLISMCQYRDKGWFESELREAVTIKPIWKLA